MSWHDYVCNRCKHEKKDVDVGVVKKHGVGTCPVCGACDWRRKFPKVNVHFKGPGFYSTDYKRIK